MDQQEINIYIEQSLKSLFGSIGSALIEFQIKRVFNYKRGQLEKFSFMTDKINENQQAIEMESTTESVQKIAQALVLNQRLIGGQGSVRWRLQELQRLE